MICKIIFWLFLFFIFYAYIGYVTVLFMLFVVRRLFCRKTDVYNDGYEPDVSLIIPAYNEADCIIAKVHNCYELDYPKEKLHIFFVTDGSTDGSPELLKEYNGIQVLHNERRKGKIHAINRCMKRVTSQVVVFTDANSQLNPTAVREIVKFFSNDKVGCVAGEKRIVSAARQKAVSAGEGLYWQYESKIKSLESATGSVLGAAGELFAVRRDLYREVPEDTLLDDFTISMYIASEGFLIKYAPGAWSLESASYSMSDELKRKIRIAAGGMQFLFRMPSLLNPVKFGYLSFKYISHKVMRWILVPFAFIIILATNMAIVGISQYNSPLYITLLFIQAVFYLLVLAGFAAKNVTTKFRILFVPYYVFMMNYAVITGFLRFLQGKYSPRWPKARRS